MKKDFVYVMLSSALPAIGNFLAVAFALRHIDSAWLGKSYALIAFFYIAIDLFNFGSPRIFTIDRVRSKISSLIFLDCFSAVGSTVTFISIGSIFVHYGVFAKPQLAVSMVLAPVCYGLSHFSLGALRLYGKSGIVCAISTFSAFCRVGVVALVVNYPASLRWLPDLMLAVEASYGAMLLCAYIFAVMADESNAKTLIAAAEERVNFIEFNYVSFILEHRKDILSSWYANAIFSAAKYADIMIVTFILGPSAAALYRGAKSVHNLAFNSGQAFALVVNNKLNRIKLSGRVRGIWSILGILLGTAGLVFISWLALRWHLFPTANIGSRSLQLCFLFVAFFGAAMIFACRIFSLRAFSVNLKSFVRISSIEVGVTLVLVAALSWPLGLLGAVMGIAISGLLVLSMLIRVGNSTGLSSD